MSLFAQTRSTLIDSRGKFALHGGLWHISDVLSGAAPINKGTERDLPARAPHCDQKNRLDNSSLNADMPTFSISECGKTVSWCPQLRHRTLNVNFADDVSRNGRTLMPKAHHRFVNNSRTCWATATQSVERSTYSYRLLPN